MSAPRAGRRRLLAAGASAAWLGTARPTAASAAEPAPTACRGDCENLIRLFAPRAAHPALAAGIVRADGAEMLYATGLANLEHGVPASLDTVFELASVSKHVTAFATLMLMRQGALTLDEPLSRGLPELPSAMADIRVADLLFHTSGLRDCLWMAELAGQADDTDRVSRDAAWRLLLRQDSLQFPPGAAFRYTNTGYFLLAELLRARTGRTLRAWTREHLFAPLGMRRSAWADDAREVVPGLACAYQDAASHGANSGAGGQPQWRRDVPRFEAVGATGMLTSASDMAAWTRKLLRPQADDQSIIELMGRPGRLRDERPVGYGGGFFLERHAGHDALVHGGSLGGFRSWLMLLPRAGLAAFVLSASPFGGRPVLERMLHPHLPSTGGPGTAPRVAPAPPEDVLDALSGCYQPANWKMIELSRSGQRLLWHEAGSTPQAVAFFEDGSFARSADAQLRYRPEWERSGAVAALLETGGGERDGALLPEERRHPKTPRARPGARELMALTGQYYCAELDAAYELALDAGGLHLQATWSGPTVRLEPAASDRFDGDRFGWMVQVERDDKGQARALLVGSPRARDFRFVRK